MTYADMARFAKLEERIESLEAELTLAKERIAELEAKRGPGRPKEVKAA